MSRLKIGNTIFDSTGATSTGGTGVVLDLDVDEPMTPVISADQFRWPIMHVYLSAANEGALNTLLEAQLALIRNCSGMDIIYEQTSGTTLVRMQVAFWPQAVAEVQVDADGVTADIAFQIIGQNPAMNIGGGSNQGGQVGEIVWQYQLMTNQLAGLVAESTFGPTSGGNSALANAQAWVAALDSGTRPNWVPAALRIVDVSYEPVQVPNQTNVFNPVRCTVLMREIPSAVIASWPSLVQDASYGVSVVDGLIDTRSGQSVANQMLLLAGQVTIRTEGNTTFASGLSKAASGEVYAKAVTAITLIVTHFEAVWTGANVTLHPLEDTPVIEIDLVQGVASFRKRYATQNIIEWSEDTELINEDPAVISRAADGRDFAYEPNGGDLITCVHALRVVAVGTAVGYRPPSLGAGWRRIRKSLKCTKAEVREGGEMVFTVEGASIFRFLNSGPKSSGGATAANRGQVDQGFIGTGGI